ncbi:MAG TPA: hypothetical protein PK926_08555 [Spirochaetota bacterium]|nr:hypothetical protein [Spirochaetota bacterium]HPI91448.1 hypothetical protein [Spirochaetota bacterium]HPR49832.1 hypothetical protein [Spirochaetota bacterium]
MDSWKSLSDEEKAGYNPRAGKLSLSGHNLYVSRWIKNRTQQTSIIPAIETIQGYTSGIHCDEGRYCRRVSRYAPTIESDHVATNCSDVACYVTTNKSSSRSLHRSVAARFQKKFTCSNGLSSPLACQTTPPNEAINSIMTRRITRPSRARRSFYHA